jgi:hypothetical protein
MKITRLASMLLEDISPRTNDNPNPGTMCCSVRPLDRQSCVHVESWRWCLGDSSGQYAEVTMQYLGVALVWQSKDK